MDIALATLHSVSLSITSKTAGPIPFSTFKTLDAPGIVVARDFNTAQSYQPNTTTVPKKKMKTHASSLFLIFLGFALETERGREILVVLG
jgi:hypothetical protein